MNIRKAITNLFTISNLLCGVTAIYAAVVGELEIAAILILAGAAFDLFDGLVARLLRVAGDLGKQLDSLADVVTFGVAPAFIALGLNDAFDHPLAWDLATIWVFFPMIIPAFSAYRLAKFNIDTRQSDSFIGLPTPAHAMFWLSIPLIVATDPANALGRLFIAFADSPVAVAIAALGLSLLMLSEIKLMSLKFSNFNFMANLRRYILIALSLLLFAFFGFASVPIILLLYFLLSISKKNHGVQS